MTYHSSKKGRLVALFLATSLASSLAFSAEPSEREAYCDEVTRFAVAAMNSKAEGEPLEEVLRKVSRYEEEGSFNFSLTRVANDAYAAADLFSREKAAKWIFRDCMVGVY